MMKNKGFTPTPIVIKHKLNKQLVRGLTLMEILVSTFLIVLTLTGLIHLFVAGKRLVMHGHSKITAGELGKVFLDPLQGQVRQDQWGTNCLSQDVTSDCGMSTGPLSGITYTPSYERSPHPLSSNIRKVVLTLNWTENLP